jgi:hypothetical protein
MDTKGIIIYERNGVELVMIINYSMSQMKQKGSLAIVVQRNANVSRIG